MYIYSNVAANQVIIENPAELGDICIKDAAGKAVKAELLKSCKRDDGVFVYVLDASNLAFWSPDSPVLYNLEASTLCGAEATHLQARFGHCAMRTFQNKEILLNEKPVFLRGYIRGIVAHDHPNMTGGTLADAAAKNIRQAKKFGFNLVRFHSTIPTEEFVNAADELGMLIHLEIGFAYDYDSQGHKKNLSMNNTAWRETILRYRNHPSIAIFCIGNEMHKAGHYPEVRKLYEEGKALAPNKLIMDNSGWGEYDRTTADIFSQHVAYFFPFKHHREMFNVDDPWRMNGSVYDAPLEADTETCACQVHARRTATPVKPFLSHEACHYIDVPDYEAMARKFDEFAARVGAEYLEKYGIKRPRYMNDLPELIRRKGLQGRMQDFIAGSQQFKMMCYKTYIERLRLSGIRGYEMLQFSDCLKYENKNGIVDFFDDDKYIKPEWMLTFNSDLALLADFDPETYYYGEHAKVRIAVSNFKVEGLRGDLIVTLDDETIYTGKDFVLAGGLQTLVELDLACKGDTPAMRTLKAVFEAGETYANSWKLWFYPHVSLDGTPDWTLQNDELEQWLDKGPDGTVNMFVTDAFDDEVFEQLAKGKKVVLFYEYGAARNKWQMPGALERFKPCIWDRGSNLGGVIANPVLQKALASNRYFDQNMQPLLEGGSKVNLDHFPCKVEQHVSGIDKPVRDRMKGLIHKIKDFIDDDTLRKFSHLFSVKVGKGLLIVCTFNMKNPDSPVKASLLDALFNHSDAFQTDCAIAPEAFIKWLDETNARGFTPEDVMNHFWEIDNKAVEDTLFWEEAGIDLSKLKE
ncbi:MAG: hypothetical protein IJT83_02085 [Victivallales bacterium]|nr:hypothetical protein [Victivallales bacterium]